jgi:integrase
MGKVARGHIEQRPSGSYRVVVYAGTDPITRRRLYFRSSVKTEPQAKAELAKLLAQASEGRLPETDATVARLMDEYAAVAEWDDSTRKSNASHIRRIIKPALGHKQVREVRAALLDKLYTRLKQCSDLSCTGKPFTEHRSVPVLMVDPGSSGPAWEQVVDIFRDAIGSGTLQPGDPLPSVRELHALQGIRTATLQYAYRALADHGLIEVRQGRTALVAGGTGEISLGGGRRPGAGHDCRMSGCQAHVCTPMAPKTIRNIHNVVSGAFDAAERWEWISKNPAASARPPTVSGTKRTATPPEDVAKVVATARASNPALALYVWLAAITGVRRGELCGLQIRDVDLEHGMLHIAFSYAVVDGKRIRKDTKTHQDRHPAIDEVTCALIAEHLSAIGASLGGVGLELAADAYVFSNDPVHATPWNPDWTTHQVTAAAAAAGVKLDIKGLRHYTASQLLAARFDLRNVAERLGHGSGGATTLRHYADPVPEVDRRAAAYLSQLTASAAAPADKAV